MIQTGCRLFTRLHVKLLLGGALLAGAGREARAAFSGTLEHMGNSYSDQVMTQVEAGSSLIWYRLIVQSNPTSTGSNWNKFREDNNWNKQIGAYTTAITLNNSDDVLFTTTSDFGGSDYGWGAPDQNIDTDLQNGKSYIFSVLNDASSLDSPGNDVNVVAVTEVNHQSALVTLGTPTTSNSAAKVWLNAQNPSAENSGSTEELWFQWTTNNFTAKNYVEVSSIAAGQSLELLMTNDVKPGAELKWLVISSGNTATSTMTSTYSGVGGFDASAIYKSAVQTYWVKPAYLPDEITEEFMYSSSASLDGKSDGYGWTNNWIESNAGSFTANAGSFANVTGYPTNLGNKINVSPGAGLSRTARRNFTGVTTGRVYLAYHLNYEFSGSTKYCGLSFMEGATEKAFIGEISGQDGKLGLAVTNGETASSYGLSAGSGNDYVVIGYYDFNTRELKAKAYYKTDSIPDYESSVTYDVTSTLAAGTITRIDGIRLASGASSGTPGNTYFDEIRVGRSWADIVEKATFVWDAGATQTNRDWSTARNWTADTEPIAPSNAVIGNSYTAVVSQAGEVANHLFIGQTDAGRLEQTGGSLSVTNLTLAYASGAQGTYELTGGSLFVTNNAMIGAAGSAATLTVHGAGTYVGITNFLQVGFSNSINNAAVLHNAGTVTVRNIYLAKSAATEGRYTMTGGVLSVLSQTFLADSSVNATGRLTFAGTAAATLNDDILVGRDGRGILDISGNATVTVSGATSHIQVGDLAGNNKTNQVNVGGGVFSVGGNIDIGDASAVRGEFAVSGGVVSAVGNFSIGDEAGSTGVFTMASGSLKPNHVYVGNNGHGAYAQSGGTVTAQLFRVGVVAGSRGSAEFTGGKLFVESTDFDLGVAATGLVTVGNTAELILGDGSGNTDVNLGAGAGTAGTLIQTGGTVTVVGPAASDDSDLVIGLNATATGRYVLAGGSLLLTNADDLIVGYGELELNGNNWTSQLDDDFLVQQITSTVRVIFNAAGVGTVKVGDDINITAAAGILSISNPPALPAGVYCIATSLNQSAVIGTFAVTNWYGNRTGTVSYANNAITLTLPSLADGDVYGNSTLIADGDATPDVADHTDFGAADITVGSVTRTYTITNISADTLGVGNVTTSGAQAAEFIVISQPAASVAGGATTTFQVTFDPSATGPRNATLSFTNNISGAKNPYTFDVRGTGTAPEIAVSGNGVNIADGDATPDVADHTDFGSVGAVGSTLSRTFTITNVGNGSLTLGSVTTGGTEAAEFVVTAQPAGPLAPEGTTSFTVEFNPTATGLRQATLSFSNGDSDENPFNFSIQGTGVAAAISNFPTTLSFSSTLGSAPADQSFGITNVGLGTLAYALSTNVDWLTVKPATASVGGGAGQVHTAVVAMSSALVPGTSNATITITDAAATNSPKSIAVSWTINSIPAPTAQSATADGKELVKLAWTPDGTYGTVLVVHQAGSAPGTPANGTSYSVGGAIPGGGTVIYKGTAAALDHIAASGATHHYKFFSVNNDYYSSAASASASLGSYQAFEIVDQLAYTNGTSVGARSGGQGFTNAWSITAGSWTALTNDFAALTGFPAAGGNSMSNAAAGTSTLFRGIPEVTAGQLYVAYQLRVTSGGGYAGLSFFDGASEQIFFGEGGGAVVNQVTVDGQGGNLQSTGTLADHTDYTLVGMYDFDNNKAGILLLANGVDSVPGGEPSAWHAQITDGDPTRINRIRIEASVGVMVDEIRVATNWPNLFATAATYPAVTSFVVNAGSPVTDAQVTSGVFTVVAHVYDAAGVETTNTAARYFVPNYDVLNTNGVVVFNNEYFQYTNYINSGTTVILTDAVHAAAAPANVTLGTYTGRFSAINSNANAVLDVRTNLFGSALSFSVVDDDSTAPSVDNHNYGAVSAQRPLRVVSNGTAVARSGSSTDTVWTVSDGWFAQLGAGGTNVLDLSVGASDAASGLSRSEAGNDTNVYMSLSIGLTVTNTMTNFSAAASSTDLETFTSGATNVFRFRSAFSAAQVEQLYAAGSNDVRVTIPDNDGDRTDDRTVRYASLVGYLQLFDDDTTAPSHSGFSGLGRTLSGATFTNVELAGGLIITGLVTDAGSGVYGGTSNLYTLTRDGTSVDSGSFTAGFANGGATAGGALSNTIAAVTIQTAGAYTLTVFSVDYDLDRTTDALATTSTYSFTVANEPQVPGLAVAPLTLAYHTMLGNDASNATFVVTNIGMGTLSVTNYQTYGDGPSAWFAANPTNVDLGTSGARVHTGYVNSASFTTSGTYVATNRVAGNQTNSAQEIVVTLMVTNIPAPQSVAATADGNELVRLDVAEAAGRQVLVVHRSGAAPSADPVNGTSYSAGQALGGGTVLFKLTGSASLSNVWHEVPAGSTNYYRFYAINNDRYSTAAVAVATSGVYQAFSIVDAFGYTNGVSLAGKAGGQGYTNAWSVTAGSWTVITNDPTALSGLPAFGGNSITSGAAGGTAFRGIPERTSGRLYVSYQLRVTSGAGYAGLSFYDGATELVFFGEGGGAVVNQLSVDGGTPTTGPTAHQLANHTDYTVIGMYDFDNDVAKALLFTNGVESLIAGEPSAWDVEVSEGDPTRINRIRIAGDAGMIVDEIRVATNWPNLFAQVATYPALTNFLVNGGSPVTDAQVTSGVFTVVAHLYDTAGVETTNTAARYFVPNYDVLNTNGVVVFNNEYFQSTNYINSGTTVILTDAVHAAVAAANVTLGTYTGRFSAINSNGNAVVDLATNIYGQAITFTVTDDDTTAPALENHDYGTPAVGKPLCVVSNGVNVPRTGSSTDTVWTVVDGYLTQLGSGGTNVFDLSVGASDSVNGLSRSETATDTNAYMSVSVGLTVTNAITNFTLAASSSFAETFSAKATNVFRFRTPFSAAQIQQLYAAGSNDVRVTVPDADADRPTDYATLYSALAGYLVVADDDTAAPVLSNFRVTGVGLGSGVGTVTVSQIQLGGWSITGRVQDALSGVNVNGSTTSDPANNISPFFTIVNSTGQTIIAAQVFTNRPADGGATALTSLGMETVTNTVPLDSIPVGTYTARVTVADNDEDRSGTDERATASATDVYVFEVVADPPSLKITPATLSFTAALAQNPSPTFQTFVATNPSATDTSFTNVITYSSGASGWLTVSPVSITVTSLTRMTLTASVSSIAVPRGTYYATNFLDGANTQLVVTLTVTGYNGSVTYDTFSGYSGVMDGENGGTGWNGSWTRNGTSPEPYVYSGSLATFDNYCNDGGDSAAVDMSAGGASLYRELYRAIPDYTNGVIYVGFKMSAQFMGSGKDFGLALGEDGTQKLKVGKVDAASDNLGLDTIDGQSLTGYGLGGGSEYLVILRYDFASRELKVKGYFGNNLTTNEQWEATTRTAPAGITKLNRLTFWGRNGLAAETAGIVRWDDVRVATTWNDLLCGLTAPQSYPYVTNALFATATDGALASSNFPVALNFVDLLGLESTNSSGVYTVPNFDLITSNGTQLIANQAFTGFAYGVSGRLLTASNDLLTASVNPTNILLGTNTLRWSAASSNRGYRYDNPYYSNGTVIAVNVVDDDPFTNGPQHQLLYVGTNYTPGTVATNITDADIVAGGKLDVAVLITDGSGVWVTNNNGAATIDSNQGNVSPNWDLTNALFGGYAADQIFTNYYGANGFGSVTAVAFNVAAISASNIVVDTPWFLTVSSQDDDKDRGTFLSSGSQTVQVDRAVTTNQSISFTIADDDPSPPYLTNINYANSSGSDAYFWIATNGTRLFGTIDNTSQARREGTYSNTVWHLTDGELWKAGDKTVTFAFGAADDYSGLRRGTSGTTNNLVNFRIGTYRGEDFTNFSAAASGTNEGISVRMTNVWTFANGAFSDDFLTSMVVTDSDVGVYLNIPDTDADRTNDSAVLYNALAGHLHVVDDDIDAYPVRTLVAAGGGSTPIATGFDVDGWTNTTTYTTGDVSTVMGNWRFEDMFLNQLNEASTKRSQRRKANINEAGAFLQLPPQDNPGAVSFWVRNSSGTATNLFTVDYWPQGGSAWVNVGLTNGVGSTNYLLLSFLVDQQALAVTTRVRAVAINSTAVYMDDVALTLRPEWTNSTALAVHWNAPTNDLSGILEFRYVHGATNAPLTTAGTTSSGTGTNINVGGAAEGVVTGYVFMVDNDSDRTSTPEVDRTLGMPVPYLARIDLTPPSNVTGCAVNTNVADPESELKMTWSGPCLTPGQRSDGTPLSPWDTYLVFYTDDGSEPSTNSPSFSRFNGPADLATNTTTSITFSNLNFDTEYRFRVAGRDRAGNVGVLSDTVTGLTEVFVVTQSLVRASNQVEVAWKRSSTGAVYDIIWQDTLSWGDTLTNAWTLMSTVTNSFDVDEGGVGRINPFSLVNTMRFYRVARSGQWQTTNLPRRASREIYVAKTYNLRAGENWLSLHAIPDTNTIARVFGTNLLPKGATPATATRISWYGGGTSNGQPVTTVYLSNSNRWIYSLGGSGVADDLNLSVNEGFVVELPAGSPNHQIAVVGELTTNVLSQTVYASNSFNMLSATLPRRLRVRDLRLSEMGFRGAAAYNQFTKPDELRILSNTNGNGSMTSPRLRVWLNSSNTNYYDVDTGANVNNRLVEPDEVLIWWNRGTNMHTWTIDPNDFYTKPSKNISP